jgi:TENA/THI-4/PQQC family.
MGNEAFVESVMHEIIRPGVDQLMNSRYFSELRQGKLSKKRLTGFAMQHYLSNHAINKGLAFCMVKNASNPPAYNQFVELFVEESSHPALMKRFGQAMGLTDEDFDKEIMIFECVAHTAAIIRGMFLGTAAETRSGALVNETMVQRYSDEFDAALEKHYGLDSRARTFFIVHGKSTRNTRRWPPRRSRATPIRIARKNWCAPPPKTWCVSSSPSSRASMTPTRKILVSGFEFRVRRNQRPIKW